MNKLDEVINTVIDKFDHYDFAGAMSVIMTFMSSDLSAFYLDISKDILYCDKKDSLRRKQTQTVIYRISEALLRLLNPVLPFTMDEFNRNLPGKRADNVQLLDYPQKVVLGPDSAKLDEEYNLFLSLRNDVLKALENARNNQIIGSSQEGYVEIELVNEKDKLTSLIKEIGEDQLAKLFVVSEVKILDKDDGELINLVKVKVEHHKGCFCERCWNYENNAIKQEDDTYLCKRCQEVVK